MVLGRPDVLESRLVGGNRGLDVIHEGVMFGVRVGLSAELGHEGLDENAELHEAKSPLVVPTAARVPGRNEAICPGTETLASGSGLVKQRPGPGPQLGMPLSDTVS